MKEVGVNVDEHPALPLLLRLEVGRQSGRDILIVYVVEIIDGGFTRCHESLLEAVATTVWPALPI